PYSTRALLHSGTSFVYLQSLFLDDSITIEPVILSMPRLQLTLERAHWCASFLEPEQKTKWVRSIELEGRTIEHRLFRMARDEAFTWETPSELAGLRIAVLRSRQVNALRLLFKRMGLESVPINSAEQGVQLLINGRADLVFYDLKSINYILQLMSLPADLLQPSEKVLVTRRSKLWFNLRCDTAAHAYKLLAARWPHAVDN
ncbi:MAG: hypothetical protein ACPG4U_16710, partial [Pseudomonadales bacterium]